MGEDRAVLLTVLAEASTAVAGTPSRSTKTALLAAALRQAGPAEVALAVAYLSGELPQRRTGVGHRSLVDLPSPAESASLELAEVDAAFEAMATSAGAGSAARRRALVVALFARATTDEQRLHIESLPEADYFGLSYYEKWLRAVAAVMLAKGAVTWEDLQ